MASKGKGKAKKARKTGRHYGFEGFEGKRKRGSRRYGFEGFEGKKRRSKKRGKYLHGGLDGFSPAMLGLDLAGLLAGAIGSSFVSNLLPIKNLKIKALIPLLAGIAIVSFPKISKNRFFNRAGLGAFTIGGVSLTRQLLPKLPLMSGIEDAEGIAAAIDALPDEEKAILGIMPTSETAGLIEDRTDGEDTENYGELAEDGEDGEDGEFIPEAAPLSPATMRI